MKKLLRQGDVMLQRIDKLPVGLKKRNSLILVYGEVTGHKHRLDKGQVFEDNAGKMFVSLKSRAVLLHEEHDPITLEKGNYAVIRQKEYLMKDMVRTVID
ncbi:hypothetical protein A2313_03785 [Candidatus Roizmanbacteria bacterium RIFOXYB2_FULL_41_10]|nr:MAG: hypothetical protein A2313_03785 [Candidatus Roizmanbacteria bacterium RIFOXYB2_FULL_41_10]